jgi:hypothetical protein
MPAEIFSFPFTHSVSIQKESDLSHDSAIKSLIEVAENAHCLYISSDDEYFVHWNLGPKEDDLNYDMMNIRRKILCLHMDVLIDSLKSGQCIHTIGLSSDNQMLHTVFTLVEPLDKYKFTVYTGIDSDSSSSDTIESEPVTADGECVVV